MSGKELTKLNAKHKRILSLSLKHAITNITYTEFINTYNEAIPACSYSIAFNGMIKRDLPVR